MENKTIMVSIPNYQSKIALHLMKFNIPNNTAFVSFKYSGTLVNKHSVCVVGWAVGETGIAVVKSKDVWGEYTCNYRLWSIPCNIFFPYGTINRQDAIILACEIYCQYSKIDWVGGKIITTEDERKTIKSLCLSYLKKENEIKEKNKYDILAEDFMKTFLKGSTCFNHRNEIVWKDNSGRFIVAAHFSHSEYLNRLEGCTTCPSFQILVDLDSQKSCNINQLYSMTPLKQWQKRWNKSKIKEAQEIIETIKNK